MKKFISTILILFLTVSLMLAAPRTETTLETDSKYIFGIAFSPHGEVLAVGDGSVLKLFCFSSLNLLHRMDHGHDAVISALVFSADSTLIVTGDMEGRISIWNLRDNTLQSSFQQPGDVITSLSLSSGNKLLAAGTTGNKTLVYDLQTGVTAGELLREDDVLAVRFHPEGKFLASGGADNKILMYDMETMAVHQVIDHHRSWVRALDFNGDGSLMISGDDNGRIARWRFNHGHLGHVDTRRSFKSWVSYLSYFNDNKTFAAASINGRISVYTPWQVKKTRSGKFVNTIILQPNKQSYLIEVIATRGSGVIIYGKR